MTPPSHRRARNSRQGRTSMPSTTRGTRSCDLAVPEHEVDLEAALRSPEVDPVAEIPVGAVRLDLHEDEVLQRPAEQLSPLLHDPPARQGARDPHVEQVELRSFADDLPLLASLPGLDEGAEKRVDEDLVTPSRSSHRRRSPSRCWRSS